MRKNDMASKFKQELTTALLLAKKHFVAIIVVSYATAILSLMISDTSPLPHLSSRAMDFLLYYGAIPLLILVVLLRKNPLRLGLGLGDYQFWIPASLLYLACSLPIIYIASGFNSINAYYTATQFDFEEYLLRTTLIMLGWEYLFRGFMIEGLRNSMKEGAILVQMIPFTLLHLGKPDAEILACIIPGLIWGYICYRSRCFWPAFFIHLITNLFLKTLAVWFPV